MADKINPAAGKTVDPSKLVDVTKLVDAYYANKPDPKIVSQRVAFGTSGHRGSSFNTAFNENHIIAISQAICLYRRSKGINGPLFIGIDTHALSAPALRSALEVFIANGVDVMIDEHDGFTPTPVISHAILTYNKSRQTGFADGVVITPSHNPPEDGGFKYNPPNGGPADTDVTGWMENCANEFLEKNLEGIRRTSYEQARQSPFLHKYNYKTPYITDLANVIDMDVLKGSTIKLGIDPLGGASVHYWPAIIEHYGLSATVVNDKVDPTFSFMTVDWDGKVRMDCSSPYAMTGLIGMRDKFDVSFANDTDADRHGIVTKSSGLMNPNHYLATSIFYLCSNRPNWSKDCAIGKTIVSSGIIDRVAKKIGRKVYEVPVGLKWFVDGLLNSSLGFAGEESAGATFLRRDGTVWTTDKDGIIPGLLAAEMTAKTHKDPGQIYNDLTKELGTPHYARIDAAATSDQKNKLKKMSPAEFDLSSLAGEPIKDKLTKAPGNNAGFGGLKVTTENGWFAARPSGTEDVYKIYAESFKSEEHLHQIQNDAQVAISKVFAKN